jgi:uncharacterized protein (DUF58 family)
MKNFLWLVGLLIIFGLGFKLPLVVLAGGLLGLAIGLIYLWKWRISGAVQIERKLPEHSFLNEEVVVELKLANRSLLPVPWLNVRELLPAELPTPQPANWLLSCRSREITRLTYNVKCKTRGRYLVGPTEMSSGVVLDDDPSDPNGARKIWQVRNCLTVYPQIVGLEQLDLPSRLPLGTLKTRLPLLPDPSRLAGIRDYAPGDDPRHIDWRNSARLGDLQIKQFERTRQMPLAIVLDLGLPDYQYARRADCETSIVVAASLANRAKELRQPFGLYSNGFDPFFRSVEETSVLVKTEPGPALHPREGEAHLAHILDKLAGLQPRLEAEPAELLLSRLPANLAWGATVAFIALEPNERVAHELVRLKKAGYSPFAIFCGRRERYNRPSPLRPAALQALKLTAYEVTRPEQLDNLALVQQNL